MLTRPPRSVALRVLAVACAAVIAAAGSFYAQSQYEVTHTLVDIPAGSLTQTAVSTFYGVTISGGEGFGTVYRLTPGGPVTVASFTAEIGFPSEGSGLLLAGDGALYGTTEGGSVYPDGTVVRVTPDGTLSVWAAFNFFDHGATPSGRLIEGTDGYLYGTALFGPAGAPGVVFRVNQAWGQAGEAGTIEAFAIFPEDAGGLTPAGESPGSGVVEVDGSFYGTAMFGGAYGAGTIFHATAGAVSAVHLFNGSDGLAPASPLLLGSDDNLYGTTAGDGVTSFGTLFRFPLDGSGLTTLVAFDGTNGDFPYQQGIVETGGFLFGTTQFGGGFDLGTVYRWSAASGHEVLHEMDDVSDGSPVGTLTAASDGALYGAGARFDGGVIFRLMAGTVVDVTPPVLEIPADLVVNATTAQGAAVTYTVSAGDDSGGPVDISCAPASGSLFSNGVTTVNCTAADPSGNTSTGSFNVTVLRQNLVAAFGFEEESAGEIHDRSAHLNNGHFDPLNGPQRVEAGRFGRGIRFDGIDDWITIPDANSLDLGASFTVMAWVKSERSDGWHTAVLKERPGGLAYAVYANEGTSNFCRPGGWVNVGGPDRSAIAKTCAHGAWTHLAATLSAGSLRIYVNGTLEKTSSAGGTVAVSNHPLRLGGNAVWGEYFQGTLDEIRLYNRSLSQTEIAEDMMSPVVAGALVVSSPIDDGLVAAYSFDDGTAVDATGNGQHGAISGAVPVAGKYGGALAFDGVNDVVAIADTSRLRLTAGMTLEAWVRPDTLQPWSTVVLKEAPSGLAYGLYANTDTNRPAGVASIGGLGRDAAGSSALPAGEWSHVVVTYNAAQLKLWVNGVQRGSRSIQGLIQVSNGQLMIGGNNVWGEYFDGVIDNVRVYNRALGAAAIQTNMGRPIQ
jgi:uncharacterized repeat protein (TIGR03803 family)